MTNEQADHASNMRNNRNGFKLFASLLNNLAATDGTQEKVSLLIDYFNSAPPDDKSWTLGLFTGRRLRRMVKTKHLADWLSEWAHIPPWLFEECYHQVGDLAETLALLDVSISGTSMEEDLSDCLRTLREISEADEDVKKETIRRYWSSMSMEEKFVFNKLITGGFRVGVSAQLVIQALAKMFKEDKAVIAHRISGQWEPVDTDFQVLLSGQGTEDDLSKPYPFFLSHPMEDPAETCNDMAEWHAEWKWDGIRGQVIRRKGQWFVWSRGEELITEKFPEFEEMRKKLPDGLVIDGEILAMKGGVPLPFSLLQTRIGRSKISPRQLREVPVAFMAFDLLEFNGEDWRMRPLTERMAQLKSVVQDFGHPSLLVSEGLSFSCKEDLAALRSRSREHGSEGLMLKRKTSTYQAGRRRGDWWKWKTDPMTIDAVLVYAQKGHGRRSSLYTDYTFAVRDGDRLVVFAKAYSGLTDKEFRAVDAFVKKNAIEKFGPVRTVKPELVFEIAFEGLSESKRHRSGIAVRFPRMSRWRTDKNASEINTLDDLRDMLKHYGSQADASVDDINEQE